MWPAETAVDSAKKNKINIKKKCGVSLFDNELQIPTQEISEKISRNNKKNKLKFIITHTPYESIANILETQLSNWGKVPHRSHHLLYIIT